MKNSPTTDQGGGSSNFVVLGVPLRGVLASGFGVKGAPFRLGFAHVVPKTRKILEAHSLQTNFPSGLARQETWGGELRF